MKYSTPLLTLSILINSLFLSAQTDTTFFNFASVLGGEISGTALVDDYALVTQGNYLKVLDLNSQSYDELAAIELDRIPDDVFVLNDYAYLAADGIIILNISDPLNPMIVGDLFIDAMEDSEIFVEGSTAFIISIETGLVFIDVSNPLSPTLTGDYTNGNELSQIAVQGNQAYVLDLTLDEMLVLDISDLTNCQQLASFAIGDPRDLAIAGNHIYISSFNPPEIGMAVVDISNPQNPTKTTFHNTEIVTGPNTHLHLPSHITIKGNHAYIACWSGLYLFIADISDPTNPSTEGYLELENTAGDIAALLVNDTSAFIVLTPFDEIGGIYEVDISDVSQPDLNNHLGLPQVVRASVTDTSRMFLATNGALWIYDMSDPENPSILGRHANWNFLGQLFLKGDTLYALRGFTMHILDVSDPTNVTEIGAYVTGFGFNRLFIAANKAFLMTGDNPGIVEIIDLQDPTNPLMITEVLVDGEARDIYVEKDKSILFIAYDKDQNNRGVLFYDISDSNNPVLMKDLKITNTPSAIEATTDMLYIASNSIDGMGSNWYFDGFDISDLNDLINVGELSGKGEMWDLELEGSSLLAIISDDDSSQPRFNEGSNAGMKGQNNGQLIEIFWDENGLIVVNPLLNTSLPKSFSISSNASGYAYGVVICGTGDLDFQKMTNKKVFKGKCGLQIFKGGTKNMYKLKRCEVVPNNYTMNVDDVMRFLAMFFNAANNRINIYPTWGTNGGSITQDGDFTAGPLVGDFEVTAEKDDVIGRAIVSVLPGAVASVEITPSTVSLPTGGQQNFTGWAVDKYGNTIVTSLIWAATGGTIDGTGWYNAGNEAGKFEVKAFTGGVEGKAQVTIRPGPAKSLTISPKNAIIGPGGKVQFVADAKDEHGNVIDDPKVWTGTGGVIDQDGLYTADNVAGLYEVVVRFQGLNDRAVVEIEAGVVDKIEVSPKNSTLPPKGTQQFNAVGIDAHGNLFPITVDWSGTGGSIDQNGLFTADEIAGLYEVIARYQGLSDKAYLEITSGQLANVEVSPNNVTLKPNEQQQFTATGRDMYGNIKPIVANWSGTGGVVDQNGLYTAGNVAGVFQVQANANGFNGIAQLEITSGPLSRIDLTPKNTTLQPNGVQQFSASGSDMYGNNVPITVTWTGTGGTINTNGLYTAGILAGLFKVEATTNGFTGQADVEIKPDPINTIQVTPANADIQVTATHQFIAQALDAHGNSINALINWGTNNGSITTDGVYSAPASVGTATVVASSGGKQGEAHVTIIPGPLHEITITPEDVKLKIGESQKFNAFGWDEFSNVVDLIAQWTGTGGAIDQDGNYTAGNNPGNYIVTAQFGTISGTATVEIEEESGVEEALDGSKYCLLQNYPNPFQSETLIGYCVPRQTFVQLDLYDSNGAKIKAIEAGWHAPGIHRTTLNLSSLSSGFYYYQIQMEDYIAYKKMVLIR